MTRFRVTFWPRAENTKSAPNATTATALPASTKDSAKSGLRSCHSRRSGSAVTGLPRDIEFGARADAALIKGPMRRTAEDVITIGQAHRLVAATLLAREPAAVPFIRSSLYAAALSWADGDTT